jgi:hypothetical protein
MLSNRLYNEAVHQVFVNFKKAYDSVRMEILHNILTEFSIPLKQVRLIRLCLSEICRRVYVGRHFSDTFPIKNGLKEGDALSSLLFNFAQDYGIRKGQANHEGLKLNDTH